MNIETLDKLIKQKHGKKAFARHGKTGTLDVSFGGDTFYTYSDSIRDLAERLELIPKIKCVPEAERILEGLAHNESVIGAWVVADTVNFLFQEKNEGEATIVNERIGYDEYGRPMARYFKVDDYWEYFASKSNELRE